MFRLQSLFDGHKAARQRVDEAVKSSLGIGVLLCRYPRQATLQSLNALVENVCKCVWEIGVGKRGTIIS